MRIKNYFLFVVIYKHLCFRSKQIPHHLALPRNEKQFKFTSDLILAKQLLSFEKN